MLFLSCSSFDTRLDSTLGTLRKGFDKIFPCSLSFLSRSPAFLHCCTFFSSLLHSVALMLLLLRTSCYIGGGSMAGICMKSISNRLDRSIDQPRVPCEQDERLRARRPWHPELQTKGVRHAGTDNYVTRCGFLSVPRCKVCGCGQLLISCSTYSITFCGLGKRAPYGGCLLVSIHLMRCSAMPNLMVWCAWFRSP